MPGPHTLPGCAWRILRWPLLALVLILLLLGFRQLLNLHVKKSMRYVATDWIDFQDILPEAAVATAENETPALRVAVAPVLYSVRSVVEYRALVGHLAGRLKRKPVLLSRKTYAEINDLLRYQACDLALIGTYPFITGNRDFGLEVLATPQIRGQPGYRALVIVPKDSPAESLSDLKGLCFAIKGYDSSSGWLFPALTLLDQGLDPNRFFRQVRVTRSHDLSIEAVLSGRAQGATVHSIVFDLFMAEQPEAAAKLKVIGQSHEWGLPPCVVHPGLDPPLKAELRRLLLAMHDDPEGLVILDRLGITRFFVPDALYYESVRRDVLRLEAQR